ncbi:MAG: FadR family transcriptional regulator [Rhizobiales bacterium]|nr:FadR family transcriptional regulator [Hyphomicrobiales bacterium]
MNFVTEGGLRERSFNHTAHVVEELGKAIVTGEYPAGTMIPLDPDISEMFNVSRTVVREAKKTLIAKGLMQSKAKVGTHVRPKSEWNMFDTDVLRWHGALKQNVEFLAELFEIRLVFEPAAAAKVALVASEQDCAQLYALIDTFASATSSRIEFAVADLEFHKAILRMTENRFLQSLGDIVQASLFSVFVASAPDSDAQDMLKIVHKHRDIVDAIKAGDEARARECMVKVIRRGQSQLA